MAIQKVALALAALALLGVDAEKKCIIKKSSSAISISTSTTSITTNPTAPTSITTRDDLSSSTRTQIIVTTTPSSSLSGTLTSSRPTLLTDATSDLTTSASSGATTSPSAAVSSSGVSSSTVVTLTTTSSSLSSISISSSLTVVSSSSFSTETAQSSTSGSTESSTTSSSSSSTTASLTTASLTIASSTTTSTTPVPLPTCANMVPNGEFDGTGIAPWTAIGGEIQTGSDAHNGNTYFAGRLTSTTKPMMSLSQTISLQPNNVYKFRAFYTRIAGGQVGNPLPAFCSINLLVNGASSGRPGDIQQGTPIGTYYVVETTVAPPANGQLNIGLSVTCTGNVVDANIAIDTVQVYLNYLNAPCPVPAPSAL